MSLRLPNVFPALVGVFALLSGLYLLPFGARTNAPAQQVTQTPGASLQRTITVSGSGSVIATPDIAVIVLGVQTDADTAGDALTANSEQMEGLMAALREAGVVAADIQTRTVQLYPRYNDVLPTPSTDTEDQQQTTQSRIAGYTAVNTVEVTVRDIDDLGALIDSAVEAGGNQIESIRFDVAQPQAVIDQAREAAFEDARRKAGQLATLADGSLGSVISVTETSFFPFAVQQESMALDRVAASVPISPGSQTLTLDVQVVFELVVEEVEE